MKVQGFISIRYCEDHDTYGIFLDDSYGGRYLLTPAKCCGKWNILRRWPLQLGNLIKDIRDFKHATKVG